MSPRDVLEGRTVSVRLDQDAFESLSVLARVEQTSMGAVIRDAIREYATNRQSEPEWRSKVEDLQRQLADLLPPR